MLASHCASLSDGGRLPTRFAAFKRSTHWCVTQLLKAIGAFGDDSKKNSIGPAQPSSGGPSSESMNASLMAGAQAGRGNPKPKPAYQAALDNYQETVAEVNDENADDLLAAMADAPDTEEASENVLLALQKVRFILAPLTPSVSVY